MSALRQKREGRKHLRQAKSYFLAGLIALCSSIAAEAQTQHGPGFDPAPVEIAGVPSQRARAIEPMDLLTLRDPEGLSISPDGNYVAFVVGQAVYETNSYRSAVYIVSTRAGSVPRNLGSAGMPYWDDINQWVPEAPQWSPDSLFFTCRMRKRVGDRWQVWKWTLESGSWKQVTQSRGDVEKYEWFPNSRQLFLETALNDVSAALPAHGVLYDGNFQPWESVPILEAIRRATPVRKEYRVFSFQTNHERAATSVEIQRFLPLFTPHREEGPAGTVAVEGGYINAAKTSPDGERIAYLYTVTDPRITKSPTQRIFVQRKHSADRVYLQMDASFVNNFWWSQDGGKVYYTELRGEGHSQRLLAASVNEGISSPIFLGLPTDYFSEFSIDAHADRIACLRERNTLPPEIVLIEMKAGNIRTLADLNPEFHSLTLSPATRMEGVNSYGDSWFAHLVKPMGYVPGKKYPLIVTTYRSGDFFLGGATGNESPIQVYASNGFAVLCFDVGRTRNIVPGDFETKLLDWASPASSIEMAVKELIDQGVVDSEKVGITGYSHGAEIVGYAVTHSKLFHAVVGAGGYDPCFYFLGGNPWHRQFTRWGIGGWPEAKVNQKWGEIAISLRANLVESPILENIADTEYIGYLSRVVSLQELGKPVELHIYPYELHVKNQPRHRYEIYVRNLNWFRFWLQDDARFEPEETEEIRRWQKLRGSGAGGATE